MERASTRQRGRTTGGGVRTRRISRDQLDRRSARLVGLCGFGAALALPIVLWHRAIGLVASDFRLELYYLLTGWSAYALIAGGLLFSLPVVLSIGRSPASRLYPRSRDAYAAWAVSLYVLGMLLASQVGQIAA